MVTPQVFDTRYARIVRDPAIGHIHFHASSLIRDRLNSIFIRRLRSFAVTYASLMSSPRRIGPAFAIPRNARQVRASPARQCAPIMIALAARA